MTAEEYIQQIDRIDRLITNKTADVLKWRERAKSLGGFSSGERVQESKDPHSVEDIISKYLDIEEEIKLLAFQRQSIIKTIERLPVDEYDVIYKFYVLKIPYKELVYDLSKSYTWIKEHRKMGLDRIQEFLNNREKSKSDQK